MITSYKTAAQRARDNEKYYRDLFLEKDRYNERTMRMGIARHRAKNRELGHDMTYGDRTENERVNKVVDFNSLLDPCMPSDRTMMEKPQWKSDNKEKWMSVVDTNLNRNPSMVTLNNTD